ncbi:MAG: hypothetical protein ACE5GO_07015 [Anaerolineales bacterium]
MKIWLVVAGVVPFNADEAVVALMARHILQGARPLFFYGQAYMGSLDAILIAIGFVIFGQQVWVIRLVQALLYLGTIKTTARLGEVALGSKRVGVLAAWLLAVPAVNVTLYTTATLGGYGEALLIGNMILLTALRIAKSTKSPYKHKGTSNWLCFSWGALAGLGLWVFGLTLVYSLPAGVFLLWHCGAGMGQSATRLLPWDGCWLEGLLALCHICGGRSGLGLGNWLPNWGEGRLPGWAGGAGCPW